jgi:hypothetical protein
VRIGLPAHLLEILDQLLTPRIDLQAMLANIVSQHGIHAVDTILDGRIGAGHAEADVIAVRVTALKSVE